MNDDQIRAELQRRAGSATRPEWTTRDVLLAVREGLDTRPQRVPTSTWAPRLSAAALAVALLALLIAVPGLTPQPPAATPTPSSEAVLQSHDFATRVGSGELRGQTILVQGRVSASPTSVGFPAPECLPANNPCPLGIFDDANTQIPIVARYLPTTESPGSGAWSAADTDYQFPALPLEGVLILRVSFHFDAEFLGLVHESPAGLLTSVADAAELDPDSVGQEEALLVSGWLADTPAGEVRFCPNMPFPDPTLDGLPSRFCAATDSLSSQARDAGEFPREPFIWMQEEAFDQFGAQGEATYAVAPRLYGGGCSGGPPPCWLWDVVARLDIDRSSEPTQPSPGPRQIGCGGWEVLIDETGLIDECSSSMTYASQEFPVAVQNQNGDQTILEVSWSAGPCDGPDRMTFKASGGDYELVAQNSTPADIICDGIIREMHVVLRLSRPIPAANVSITYERAPATTSAPSATPHGVLFDCPPTWHIDPDTLPLNALHPTVVDFTGLVESCTKPKTLMADWSQETTTVGNPDGDLKALQIEWGGTPCGAASEFTLRKVGEVYVMQGRSTYEGEYCIMSAVGHQVRINLSEPITAHDVTFAWDYTSGPSPNPTAAYSPDELAIGFCNDTVDVEGFAQAHHLAVENEHSNRPEGRYGFRILDGMDAMEKVDQVLADPEVCDANVVWIVILRDPPAPSESHE